MWLHQLIKDHGPCNLELKRKIQPEVESYKLQATSYKRQAPSDTTCGCVDKFNKDLTMVQGYCRMSILTNTGEINERRNIRSLAYSK